jgi:hypothetical protein
LYLKQKLPLYLFYTGRSPAPVCTLQKQKRVPTRVGAATFKSGGRELETLDSKLETAFEGRGFSELRTLNSKLPGRLYIVLHRRL